MMLGRQRASVEEGRGEGGKVGEQARKGRDEAWTWTAGGRKRAEEGLSEEGREHGSKGGKLQGRYPEEGIGQYPVYYIHKPSDNASLAIDTLLLQMNYGEQV